MFGPEFPLTKSLHLIRAVQFVGERKNRSGKINMEVDFRFERRKRIQTARI